jgi:hypothetical protein
MLTSLACSIKNSFCALALACEGLLWPCQYWQARQRQYLYFVLVKQVNLGFTFQDSPVVPTSHVACENKALTPLRSQLLASVFVLLYT